MWLKILKYAVIVARAAGLDKKVKEWVGRRLDGIEDRVLEVDNELKKEESDG